MIDDRTTETATGRLRALLNERDAEWKQGMAWNVTVINGDWLVVEDVDFGTLSVSTMAYMLTPEQAIAATLGSERDEIYNAGFDNGVKACLQILDGYLDYPHSAVENISKWVDEQWKEYES